MQQLEKECYPEDVYDKGWRAPHVKYSHDLLQ